MHILLGLDLSLFALLFIVAGISGLIVRIDQWVEGDFVHPATETGNLDILRSLWSYVLLIILSGLAGAIVAVGASYILNSSDPNILMFIALMIGAIGKLIFYKLVEWIHNKFDDSVHGRERLTGRPPSRRNGRR